MLFVLFQLGEDCFALDARQIEEVLPLVTLTRIPLAPAGVVGVFSYHGVPVPVIDLSELTLGRSAHKKLNTRLILVHFKGQDEVDHLLGLIAEKATETLRCEPEDFSHSGVSSQGAPFLGPVASVGGRLIQRVEIDQLLSASVSAALFNPLQDAS